MFLSGLEEENSDTDSYPNSTTTSVTYSYTVKSINSRKSRTTVLYRRPVRPLRMSGVETIPESTITGMGGLNLLSDRAVSLFTSPPHGDLTPLADKQVSQWRAVSRLGT